MCLYVLTGGLGIRQSWMSMMMMMLVIEEVRLIVQLVYGTGVVDDPVHFPFRLLKGEFVLVRISTLIPR